jgi:hypothetical protein
VTRFALALLVLPVLLGGGCASFGRDWLDRDLLGRDAARALADADARAAYGDYPAAMAAYDAYLARYPNDGGADRARAVRALVSELMAARAERDRLVAHETELTRQVTARETELTRQTAARDAELARLRQELVARLAEIARLREDLEALKRTDLQMERRRR